MTDIGRVGMVDKGNYNSGSTYEAMDVVTYNSVTYIAIQNVPVNTAPTNTSYWRAAFSNAAIGDLANLTTISKTSLVDAINEVNEKATDTSVSVIADGTKTIAQLFNELFALVDFGKITHNCKFVIKHSAYTNFFQIITLANNAIVFYATSADDSNIYNYNIQLAVSGSKYLFISNNTISDQSLLVEVSGTRYELIY